nr:hypothetical protein [Microbacterium barkeri]
METRTLRDLLDAQLVVSAVEQQRAGEPRPLMADLSGHAVLHLGEHELQLPQGALHLTSDHRRREPRITALLGDDRDRPVAQRGPRRALRGLRADPVEEDGAAHLHDQMLDRVPLDRGRLLVGGEDLLDERLHGQVERSSLAQTPRVVRHPRHERAESRPGDVRRGDVPRPLAPHVMGDAGRRDHEPALHRHPGSVRGLHRQFGGVDEREDGVIGVGAGGVDGELGGTALHRQQDHRTRRALRRPQRCPVVERADTVRDQLLRADPPYLAWTHSTPRRR